VVYLGSAAHFALVQHGTCLEHGEVIHLDELRASAQPQPPEASFSDARLTRAGQEIAASHEDEAHCSHVFLRRQGLAHSACCLLTTVDAAESVPVIALEPFHPEPVARLRLAPKASPPLS
jgi:hypothetical protein